MLHAPASAGVASDYVTKPRNPYILLRTAKSTIASLPGATIVIPNLPTLGAVIREGHIPGGGPPHAKGAQ